MSSDQPTDPFELFRSMSPLDNSESGELSATDEQLLARILATPVDEQPGVAKQRPTRRRLAVATGVVMTAALATAAFTFLRSEPVTNPTAVSCYSTADLGGDIVGLGSSADPIEACRAVWREGDLRTDGTVPPLVGCVNAAGAAAVFPGEGDVCERLGLPNLEAGLTDEQVAIIELQETLIDTFLDRCFTEDEAVAEARRQLDAAGLDNWTAEPAEAFPVGLSCAGVGVDPNNELVIVVGVRPDE